MMPGGYMNNVADYIAYAATKYNKSKSKQFRRANASAKFLKPLGLALNKYPPPEIWDGKLFTPKEEMQWFSSLHYIKYLLNMNSSQRLCQALFYYTRNRIIHANNRFVVHMAKRTTSEFGLDFHISCGHVGLMRAVITFDPWRGNKFSTYAYYAVKREIGLSILKERKIVSASYLGSNPDLNIPEIESSKDELELWIAMLKNIIKNNTAGLDERERKIMEEYYEIGEEKCSGEVFLRHLAEPRDLTVERIRQIKKIAINKVKAKLLEDLKCRK
jgi:RNA polymerase sigma factor (sigma-70 family)